MGLMDKLKGELVDIIEWIDDSRSTLAWRFPRYNNEIKNGAQLIVREGQEACFVYRGALADRFGLPVHAIGVGEGEDDLRPFEADAFARRLVGLER